MHPDVAARARRALLGAQPVLGHDVADADAAAGLRAPGRSPRTPRSLSGERLMTQFEMTTSTVVGGQRHVLDVALEELDVRRRRPCRGSRRRARASPRSCPGRTPCPSARRARRRAARRSRRPTRGRARPRRGFSSATAIGLPQPRLASTASSGSASRSDFSYSTEPKLAGDAPHAVAAPAAVARDAERGLGVMVANRLAHVAFIAHLDPSVENTPDSCRIALRLSE